MSEEQTRTDPSTGTGKRGDTKAQLVAAAVRTLQVKGFAGASAREIAATGGLNQALVFYHFGSVRALLLAALEHVSARRIASYGARFERAHTLRELAELAREIYAEDLENGYVTVLGEMVAGGVSDPELGAGVVALIEPWIEMVAGKIEQLTAGSALAAIIPAREAAFAIVALYFGIDLLGHLDGSHARAQSLLELGLANAALLELVLGLARRGAAP